MSKKRTAAGSGRNRAEKRAEARNPQRRNSSGKPIGLRIAIVLVMLAMLLGFFIVPLLGR